LFYPLSLSLLARLLIKAVNILSILIKWADISSIASLPRYPRAVVRQADHVEHQARFYEHPEYRNRWIRDDLLRLGELSITEL